MSFKMFRHSKKIISFVLCLALVSGLAGCSPNADQPAITDTSLEPSSFSENSGSDAISFPKITDNGQPIYDFDEYVNGEIYAGLAGNAESITYNSSAYLEYIDHVKEIIESVDISSLSEEDGLYKVVTLYNELTDYSNTDSRSEAIKAYLKHIDDADSLNDLYELYSKPEYAMVNYLINIDVKPDYQCIHSIHRIRVLRWFPVVPFTAPLAHKIVSNI